jgi:tellurite resistance protein TerC
MYFSISGVMAYFRFLNYGLAAILAFVGVKLMLHSVFHVPTAWSLGVIGALLAVTILLSLLIPEKPAPREEHG